MGSLDVVFLKPMLRGFSCFTNRLEEPAVQATVSKDTVERLVMSVLPRTSGLDETNAYSLIFDPFLDLLRNELGTVSAVHRPRNSVKFNELLENTNHIDRSEMSRTLDPKSASSELVDDREKAQCLPIRCLIRDEVVAPGVVRILSALWIDRARSGSTPRFVLRAISTTWHARRSLTARDRSKYCAPRRRSARLTIFLSSVPSAS